MVTIRADNRSLLDMLESFSYLTANYNSGVTSLVVTNCAFFTTDDPILLGQFGSETAEIAYVASVNTSTNTLALESATKFAHPESTRVSKLRYSMIQFLWGDGPNWDALGTPPTAQTPVSIIGDSTTEWNINSDGTYTTYVWTGTGKNPRLGDYFAFPLPVTGSYTQRAWVYSPNFSSNNNVVTTAGALIRLVNPTSFVIANAGSSQTGVTTGTGYIRLETTYIDVTPDSFYTVFRDNVLTTGFGYFSWWNPRSHIGTIIKNPVPYLGFPANSAKSIIDDFFSTLNSKELKLITREDAFRWLSEAYSQALNELNLVNKEYSALLPFAITTTAGTQEYALPANCSRVMRVNAIDGGTELGCLRNSEIEAYENSGTTTAAFYIRGVKDLEVPDYSNPTRNSSDDAAEMYIGIVPEPTGAVSYQVRYIPKATPVIRNYDAIFLPNNNFYFLKDFMMFRAAPKLGRGDGSNYYTLFMAEINKMKYTAVKQDNRNDSWSLEPTANV